MLTEARVKEKIVRRLGGDLVQVELTNNDWIEIFDDSYRWWVVRKSLTKKTTLVLMPGVSVYNAPADFKSLENFILPQVSRNSLEIDSVAECFGDDDRYVPSGSLTDVVMQRQHDHVARQVFGMEMDIVVDESGYNNDSTASSGVVFILSPAPKITGVAWVYYGTNAFGAEDWKFLKPRDEELLLTCIHAMAKQIVGRKRSKFSDFQLPGGIVTLDGPTLIDEGTAMLEKLEIEINNSQDPMPMFIG